MFLMLICLHRCQPLTLGTLSGTLPELVFEVFQVEDLCYFSVMDHRINTENNTEINGRDLDYFFSVIVCDVVKNKEINKSIAGFSGT